LRDACGFHHRSQLGQPHAVSNSVHKVSRHLERQARLADPAGSGECQQASGRQQVSRIAYLLFPPDGGQIVRRASIWPDLNRVDAD